MWCDRKLISASVSCIRRDSAAEREPEILYPEVLKYIYEYQAIYACAFVYCTYWSNCSVLLFLGILLNSCEFLHFLLQLHNPRGKAQTYSVYTNHLRSACVAACGCIPQEIGLRLEDPFNGDFAAMSREMLWRLCVIHESLVSYACVICIYLRVTHKFWVRCQLLYLFDLDKARLQWTFSSRQSRKKCVKDTSCSLQLGLVGWVLYKIITDDHRMTIMYHHFDHI